MGKNGGRNSFRLFLNHFKGKWRNIVVSSHFLNHFSIKKKMFSLQSVTCLLNEIPQ